MKSLLTTVDETIREELDHFDIPAHWFSSTSQWATRAALAWLLKRARRDEGEVEPQGEIANWLEEQIAVVLKEIDDT